MWRWAAAHRWVLAVLVVAVFSFYERSWEGDLHGDPLHYAAIAKTMAESGEWLVPYDAPGTPYVRKPPLMFWLVGVNFRLFGTSTYAAKFWSAAFAVGACVATFLLGRRLFGEAAGLLAACALATFPQVILNAVDLRLDSGAMLATVLAVYAVVRADQENRPAFLLLAGLAMGLGVMVKCSAALGAGVMVIVVLALRRPRWLVHPHLLGAVLVAAAVAAPWHLFMIARYGSQFTGSYFGEQIHGRVVPGAHLLTNLGRFAGVLAIRTLPWTPFAALALARWRAAGLRERWGMKLALVWLAVLLAIMAIPPRVYDRYTMLVCPAVALLAGYGVSLLLSARRRDMLPGIAVGLSVVVGCLLAVVPVPMHVYRWQGLVQARPLVDHLEPGRTIARFDPHAPEGPSVDPDEWNPRSAALYYLDRNVVNYADPATLAASDERFVIAAKDYDELLAGWRFESLLKVGKQDWLYGRLGARPHAAAPGADPAH